jgi:uncharacterized repeat protein (TIGR01451 family)
MRQSLRQQAGALYILLALVVSASFPARPVSAAVGAPTLKWAYKGCSGGYCETGWYSSPAVADLDGDGKVEVIAAAYSVFVLDGATGSLIWEVASGHDRSQPGASPVGRTWPDVVVADLDANGDLEIVTAHGGGWLSVYNQDGYFEPGWPKQVTPGNELRSLGVYDLDNDHRLEIVVASTRSENQWFVYEPDGSLRAGSWPQHSPDSNTNGYTAGCYNQNLAAGDLDGDGRGEIVGPNDTHYLAAYQDDGSQLRASLVYGTNPDGSAKVWSRVGVHVSHAVDLRGYANCGSEHRPNFADSAPVIVDIDQNGSQEVVVVGNVYDCGTSDYTSLYEIPYILNGDRTRWAAGGDNWTNLPTPEPGAAPLSQDYNRIETNRPNPVPADLDGDGKLEILYPSYDGRLHAYSLDKTQPGLWPYKVKKDGESLIRFASEPVVADLENNGPAEVIFTSWVEKGSGQSGRLTILSSQGSLLKEVSLPAPATGAAWNGGLAAPTLANLDNDADLEVVVNTAHSGLVAYDLPGSAGARVLWGTGRGSFQRSGSPVLADLLGSNMRVDRHRPVTGDTLTFTITIRNAGPAPADLELDNPIPAELAYTGSLTATTGSAAYAGGVVTWNGALSPGSTAVVTYVAQVTLSIPGAAVIENKATLRDDQGQTVPLKTIVIYNGLGYFLPVIYR